MAEYGEGGVGEEIAGGKEISGMAGSLKCVLDLGPGFQWVELEDVVKCFQHWGVDQGWVLELLRDGGAEPIELPNGMRLVDLDSFRVLLKAMGRGKFGWEVEKAWQGLEAELYYAVWQQAGKKDREEWLAKVRKRLEAGQKLVRERENKKGARMAQRIRG